MNDVWSRLEVTMTDEPAARARAVLPRTVPAIHLPAVTRVDSAPPLKLCQEFWMRTGYYDDLARVTFRAGRGITLERRGDYAHTNADGVDVLNTTFASGVAQVGLEAAIAAIYACLWCSLDDFQSTEPIDCTTCLEVRHS